jgi:hypothetical protein
MHVAEKTSEIILLVWYVFSILYVFWHYTLWVATCESQLTAVYVTEDCLRTPYNLYSMWIWIETGVAISIIFIACMYIIFHNVFSFCCLKLN